MLSTTGGGGMDFGDYLRDERYYLIIRCSWLSIVGHIPLNVLRVVDRLYVRCATQSK